MLPAFGLLATMLGFFALFDVGGVNLPGLAGEYPRLREIDRVLTAAVVRGFAGISLFVLNMRAVSCTRLESYPI